MSRALRYFASLALALGACEGEAPDVATEGDAAVVVPPSPEPLRCDVEAPADPGPALVRRLNRDEYDQTVRDLFGWGDARFAAEAFPADEEMLGFDNNARALQVSPLHTEQYLEAAEAISARAWGDRARLLPCDPAVVGEAECLAQFVRDFAARAWRRPLAEVEVAQLAGVYEAAAELDGPQFEEAFRLVVEALLQSPNFLYLVEVGEPIAGRPGVSRLTGYEVASRLSYLLWRSMPDEALLQAAAEDALGTPAQVAAQAARMLDDPRARDALWRFFEQWLHVDEVRHIERDPTYYPEFEPRHRDLLHEEARRFVEHAVWTLGDVRALLDGSTGFLNEDLAQLYREPGPAGDAFVEVARDPARRKGLLALGAVLAVTAKANMTSPVHRGQFVREQLLCTPLPPPPPDVAAVAPDPDPRLSTRERFAEHSADPACAGCHRLMDPIGFGLEHYDALGRWRNFDGDVAVDARGELTATLDADGAFVGGPELAARLAGSEQVHRCVVTQLFRYAFGRGEGQVDACTLDALYGELVSADHDFRSLVLALVQSEAFRLRRTAPDEAVQPEGEQ